MRVAASAPSARASASGSACASASWSAFACAWSACRQFSDPLLESRKAARELSQTLSAIPRWSGSGLGPSLGGGAGVRAGIQAASFSAARERGEGQGGEAKRERAGTFAPTGAGDLPLPEVEEATGERGRIVVIVRRVGATHGRSIAEAPAPSLTWPAPRTMLGP